MQEFVFGEHKYQRSSRLLHRHGDGAIAETLAQLSYPRFYRFRRVLEPSAFPLL